MDGPAENLVHTPGFHVSWIVLEETLEPGQAIKKDGEKSDTCRHHHDLRRAIVKKGIQR